MLHPRDASVTFREYRDDAIEWMTTWKDVLRHELQAAICGA